MQCGISYPRVDSGQTSDDWDTLLAPVPSPSQPRILLAGEQTSAVYLSKYISIYISIYLFIYLHIYLSIGEHTSRTHGRVVHGARDTGVTQAQAIVTAIGAGMSSTDQDRCGNDGNTPSSNQCFEITPQTVASGTWTCRSMKRANVDDPLSERICVIWELGCSDERRMDCMLACAPGQGGPWFYQVKCNFHFLNKNSKVLLLN